jgi:hypothetical protein
VNETAGSGEQIIWRRASVPMREDSALQMLSKALYGLPPGAVEEVSSVAALLAGCWRHFAGGDSERMHAGKLGRMENLRWDPPVLSFTIERHGGMGLGSTRAELQDWRVDLDRKTAKCQRSRSYRQVLARAEGIRIEPIARELADSIMAARADRRLKWQGGETVRVLMAEIVPSHSGYKQTVTGRRKRLRAVIQQLLIEKGWREIRRDVYSKTGLEEAEE